jgi:ubiquitin C-terminal hydrolase
MDAEQQEVNLKLCLYGGKEATVEKAFSKTTTLNEIQHEMRKLFNVDPERETKLWINSSVYVFKPETTDNGTGEEAVDSSSDAKENNCNSNQTANETNGISSINSNNNNVDGAKANNNASPSANSSPIKPPPTPPPMPTANSSSSPATSSQHNNNNNSASPNVITRQAAQSMNKQQQPIALPDSTSLAKDLKNFSYLDSLDSLMLNYKASPNNDSNPMQTLSEANVPEAAIVTLEVINNDGTWPSSRPRYGAVTTRSSRAQPGLCGLSNMGNTCFMNAALQCLSNTPPLTNYILTDAYVNDINPDNPLGMHGEIARTYAELIKVIWAGFHTSFLPREFKCAVSRFAPQFTGFAQQDCQELMAFLLDGLHEDLNRIKNKPYIETKSETEKRPDEEVAKESWENYKKRNDSIVVDTFHAMLKSTLVCPECNLVSVTFDPFCYLSLPLPVKREKQVTMTFLPRPAKLDESKIKTVLKVLDPKQAQLVLEYGGRLSSFDMVTAEYAGYASLTNRPKSCKMQVPRSGPASELCEIVARIINEERPEAEKVEPANLLVAEMATTLGRVSKIYESSEHYNQICDDVVVIEKASKYTVPLYIREEISENNISSIVNRSSQKLLFLHVPDLRYETIYQSIIVNLSNITTDCEDDIKSWCPLNAPQCVDHPMECDDDKTCNADTGDCNGTSSTLTNGGSPLSHEPAFSLSTVNSHGTHSFEILGPNSKECDSSKLYLGAVFESENIAASPQFEHNREPGKGSIETFTPKVSPKPTLQLKDCITQFTNAERLGADDPWYCPKCKKHQQAIKKFDVWSLPKVLIIHLKRFSFSRSWRDKIDTLVEFPVEGLDMSSYVHNPEQKKQEPIIYDLIGVANHFGGLGGGHYTAYAKNAPLDSWYSFDDALVCPTSAANVVTRSAYVLFYQMRE